MVTTGDPNNLPSENPPKPPDPTELATAAAKAVIDSQNAASKAALEDSLDIRDPGRPQPAAAPTTNGQPKPTPATQPQPTDGITEDLLDRAYAVGIPEADARQYGSHLQSFVERLEDAYSYEPEPTPAPVQTTQPQQPQQQPQWLQPMALPNPKDENIVWDDALVEAFNHNRAVIGQQSQMIGFLAQQQLQMQQQLQQFADGGQQRQNQDDRATMDRLFAADKDYRDVIGEGSYHDVVGTRHQAIRQQVGVRMQSILEEYNRAGYQPPVDQIYREAMNSLYGARAKQQAVGEISDRLRNRAGQFVARPTATTRTNEMPHGTQRAEAAVEALLREQRQR